MNIAAHGRELSRLTANAVRCTRAASRVDLRRSLDSLAHLDYARIRPPHLQTASIDARPVPPRRLPMRFQR